MGPADEDLRTTARAADLEDVGLDVLADPVVLDGRLLGCGQDRLDVVADVEDDRPRLDAIDEPRDHLALAVGELVEDLVALDLADPLEHDLLGGLSADPAEDVVGQLLGLDKVARLGLRVVGAGLVHAELDERVLNLIDGDLGPEHTDLAGLGVDPDVDVLVARDASIGRLDAVLDRVDQLLPRDLLLGVELEEGTDEIATHVASSLHAIVRWADIKKRGGHPRMERPFSCRELYTRTRGRLKPEASASISCGRNEPRVERPRSTSSRGRAVRGRHRSEGEEVGDPGQAAGRAG